MLERFLVSTICLTWRRFTLISHNYMCSVLFLFVDVRLKWGHVPPFSLSWALVSLLGNKLCRSKSFSILESMLHALLSASSAEPLQAADAGFVFTAVVHHCRFYCSVGDWWGVREPLSVFGSCVRTIQLMRIRDWLWTVSYCVVRM